MRWDIAQMVSNTDPGWIKKRLEEMLSEAQRAKEKYYGKILSYDATEILNLFEYRDRFTLEYEGVIDYCSLRYSADSTDPVSKELFDAMRNATSKTGQILAFVELELGKLLENKPQLEIGRASCRERV